MTLVYFHPPEVSTQKPHEEKQQEHPEQEAPTTGDQLEVPSPGCRGMVVQLTLRLQNILHSHDDSRE